MQLIARFRKLAAILRQPEYRHALLHGVAASVEHDVMPLRRDYGTVIDVGANRGQFAVYASRRFPNAKLICFEPLFGPRARLARAVGVAGRVRISPFALASSPGEAKFHVSMADDSSSLLPIGPRQLESFPGTDERTTVAVQTRRLDDVVSPDELCFPVLLKIDVQGGELGVLQGAEVLLQSIDAVLVEVSFVELYGGQALVDDVWSHLHDRGFSCRGLWSMAYGTEGECLQGDLLFARSGFEALDR